MKFLAADIFSGFASEPFLSFLVFLAATAFITATVAVAVIIHNRKIRINKQELLKAEIARKQAKLDEDYFQRKSKLLEERAKTKKNVVEDETEKSAFREEKRNIFRKSSEYDFVREYARKSDNKGNDIEFLRLQLALSNEQWDFPADELKEFVQDEHWQKLDDFINERVFVRKPSTFNQAIKLFLEQCGQNDFGATADIRKLFKENGVDESGALRSEKVLFDFLKAKIKKVEEEIESEKFEKSLDAEIEQVWLEYIG